jgi:DNA-binding PucR family transcriptional regulator
VAYRLERIETLLGRDLDGDAAVRLGAALLALRVSRRVGIIGHGAEESPAV